MTLNIAYKNRTMMAVMPEDEPVEIIQPVKQTKSIYTLAREARFRKASLKKYDTLLKEIKSQ